MAKIPLIRFPNGPATDYYKIMLGQIKEMHELTKAFINAQVIPYLKANKDTIGAREFFYLAHRAERISRREDSAHPLKDFLAILPRITGDDAIDDIIKGLDNTDEQARKIFTEQTAQKMAGDFIGKVRTHGTIEVGRQVKAVLGFDPLARSPKLEEATKAAVKENVGLIKSIPVEYHKKIENLVLTSVRSGRTGQELADDLEEAYKITAERAKLIAVDQAGKMLGDVTSIRHTDLGLEYFRWRDSNDNRVRPKHRIFNNNIYSWATGAPGSIFPGQEVRCRCTAEVLEEELLDKYEPAPEKKRPTPRKPKEIKTAAPILPGGPPETWAEYLPFDTKEKAAAWARQFAVEEVNYGSMTLEQVNEANRALFDMIVKPKRQKLAKFITHANDKPSDRTFAHVHYGQNEIHFLDYGIRQSKKVDDWKNAEQAFINRMKKRDDRKKSIQATIDDLLANWDAKVKIYSGGGVSDGEKVAKDYLKALKKNLKEEDKGPVIFRWITSGDDTYGIIVHEYGHIVHNRYGRAEIAKAIGVNNAASRQVTKKAKGFPLTKPTQAKAFGISEYAGTNVWEYFAESWAAYNRGGWERNRLPAEIIDLIETVIKSGRL